MGEHKKMVVILESGKEISFLTSFPNDYVDVYINGIYHGCAFSADLNDVVVGQSLIFPYGNMTDYRFNSWNDVIKEIRYDENWTN